MQPPRPLVLNTHGKWLDGETENCVLKCTDHVVELVLKLEKSELSSRENLQFGDSEMWDILMSEHI